MKFVKDDGGRRAAGYRVSDDCVVRSVALVSGRKYRVVRKAAAALVEKSPELRVEGEHKKEDGVENGVEEKIARKLAKQMGLVRVPAYRPNMSLADVGKVYRTAVCSTNEHWTAIVNGVLRDADDFRKSNNSGKEVPRKARSVWVKQDKLRQINQEISLINQTFQAFVSYEKGRCHKEGFGAHYKGIFIFILPNEKGGWNYSIDDSRDRHTDSCWAAVHLGMRWAVSMLK